jgi:predicted DCC family thiol-disulfide oxidoreductase YuxK
MLGERVIYFDGVCNLCNGFVNFLIKIDRKAKFKFAPLQGVTASENKINFSNLTMSEQSLLYSDHKNSTYQRSNAVIQILNDLFFLGFMFRVLKLIPLSLRDKLYVYIATNRYRIFGEKSSCRVPSESEKERFLS